MSGKAVAIIPARGGSKGIPRKNARPLAGKPLVAWSIDEARAARHVDRVVVSTDDAEIADIARRYGAQVVMRPDELSGDSASSESALLHSLDELAAEGYEPELIVFLQCTSPLTIAADIDGTIDAMREQHAQTALAVIDFHYFVWQQDETANAFGINHDKSVRLMRQDREQQLLETGAIYVMQTAGFREKKHRFFGKTATYIMPQHRRLEIDEPVDFEVAEHLLRHRLSQEAQSQLPQKIDAVIFDFDGVFTDNGVIVNQDGVESVRCDRMDGLGINMLEKAGVPMLVLSKEPNPVVMARCQKLRLECLHGIDEKGPALRAWLNERGYKLENTVYIGNDVNDEPCLKIVGCPVVVADAHPSVKPLARIILDQPGGRGAVRALCDIIIRKVSNAR